MQTWKIWKPAEQAGFNGPGRTRFLVVDSRPRENVDHVETCLAGRAHLSPAEPVEKPCVFAGFVWVPGRAVAWKTDAFRGARLSGVSP